MTLHNKNYDVRTLKYITNPLHFSPLHWISRLPTKNRSFAWITPGRRNQNEICQLEHWVIKYRKVGFVLKFVNFVTVVSRKLHSWFFTTSKATTKQKQRRSVHRYSRICNFYLLLLVIFGYARRVPANYIKYQKLTLYHQIVIQYSLWKCIQ